MLSFDLLWHMNLWRIIRMLLQLSPILKLFIADVAPEQKKNYYPSLLLEKKSELCRSFYAFLFCFFCSSLFPTSSLYNKIQSAYEPVIWYSVSETSPVIRLLTNQN